MNKENLAENSAIAIIGMGCYYPGSNDLKTLWENILAGKRQFRRFPDERLPLELYYDPERNDPDKTYASQAACIEGFEFDWIKRRVPKKTIETTDIVHWLAYEAALQALESSGYQRGELPKETTGVILGNTLTGEQSRALYVRQRWPYIRRVLEASMGDFDLSGEAAEKFLERTEEYYKSIFPQMTEDSLAGGLANTIAGRVCNVLDVNGGGFTVDGACASSLLAVATAADKLMNGSLDVALAGGVDVSMDTFEMVGFARTGALTPDDMRVYDRRGNGFIPGEGCGFIIMKRLADARRDGDKVYAVLRGWGVSSDGRGGITAPNGQYQSLALRRAYAMAGYPASELDFIEGHGTGTKVGDREELRGVAMTVGDVLEGDLRGVGITSFKSIMGHTKAAAGAGGLIKAILAVNQRVLPPTANCEEPNPYFVSDEGRNVYPILLGEVHPQDKVMRAGVSAMGFGGINTHVTVESGDAPFAELQPDLPVPAIMASTQKTELYPLAAADVASLIEQAQQLKLLAFGMSISELPDLAAQWSQQQDLSHPVRAALIAGHPKVLDEQLQLVIDDLQNLPLQAGDMRELQPGKVLLSHSLNNARVGFLFPGQGSQQINMGYNLVRRFEWAQSMVIEADQATKQSAWSADQPLHSYIYRPSDRALHKQQLAAWKQALTQTNVAQPAICLTSAMWNQRLQRLGIKPSVVGGHSLGELSAFHAAGAYDLSSLISLATLRGNAMNADSDQAGAMAALMCDQEQARALLAQVQGYSTIANINDFQQTVVSGEEQAINDVIALAREQGVQATKLAVSNAFHSKLVQGAADALLAKAPLPAELQASVPIISAINGEAVAQGSHLPEYFSRQVLSQVDFISLVQGMAKRCDLLLEVGTGRVLTNMASRILKRDADPKALAVETKALADADLNGFLAHYFTAGGSLDWSALYDGRLIRPFVSAKNKIFIENPCERPFQVSEANPALKGLLGQPQTHTHNQSAEMVVSAPVTRQVIEDLDPASVTPVQTAQLPTPAQGQMISMDKSNPVASLLLELIEENTGFPQDSLDMDLRLLDDLNLDSIKAAELIGETAQRLGLQGDLDPAPLANATLTEVVMAMQSVQQGGDPNQIVSAEVSQAPTTQQVAMAQPVANTAPALSSDNTALVAPTTAVVSGATAAAAAASSVTAKDEQLDTSKAENALLGLIEESTGFPRESLEMDLRLLDDLNLDSIKAAELIGAAAQELQLQGEIDPAQYANASLQELALVLTTGGDAEVQVVEQGAASSVEPNATMTASASVVAPALPEAPQAAVPSPQVSTPVSQAVIKQAAAHESASTWVRDFVMWPVLQEIVAADKTEIDANTQAAVVCEREEVDLARALAGQLKRYGIKTNGASYKAVRERDSLLESVSPRYVFIILPRNASEESAEATLRKMVERLHSVANIKSNKQPVTICFAQFAGGHFGIDSALESLEQGGSLALASSLHLEQKGLQIRAVDFASYVNPEAFAEKLMDEVATKVKFAAAGYSSDMTRCVLRPRVHEPFHHKPRQIQWTKDDVVLVTGGAKGITAECALAFARATQVKMALVGSSPMPVADDMSQEVNQTLKRFADAGLQAHYYSCDLAKSEAVQLMLAEVEVKQGEVSGIIHGAAVNKPRPMSYVSAADAYREVSPKVLGAMHLCKAFEERPVKLFAALTSIIGVSGMIGNSWYGFSNEVLDLMLGQYAARHPKSQVISAAFSVWGEVGMGARMGSTDYLEKMGISAIPTKDGVKRFLDMLLLDPKARQVIVTARLSGLDTWVTPESVKPPSARYLEEIVYQYPQLEVVARAHLTEEKDPYIKDHVWKGSNLFATVFGLEAMAQAVAYVTGQHTFQNLRIEDITLERPIVVGAKNGLNIQIHARVLERKTKDEHQQVEVSISTEQSHYRIPHFSARFVLGGAQNLHSASISGLPEFPAKSLDIDPKEDLYSWLLFQGPMYQRLNKIYRVDNDICMFDVKSAKGEEQQWMLGSPFVRDALLQSVQPMVPQHISLPVRIGALNIADAGKALSSQMKGTAVNEKLVDGVYTTSVYMADSDFNVLERLENYHIRILEYRENFPTVNELVAPKGHDEASIIAAAKDCAEQLQVELPLMKLDYIPNLSKMQKDERHNVMEPAIESWATTIFAQSMRLQWLQDGKPQLVDSEGKNHSLSVSHNNSHLLTVSGQKEYGCDLEVVQHRSEQEWHALLGADNVKTLEAFVQSGDSLNIAGTRLWTVREAIYKAVGEFVSDIDIKLAQGRNRLLSAQTAQGELEIVSFPVSLLRGGEKMTAISTLSKMEIEIKDDRQMTQETNIAVPSSAASKSATYLNAPKASTLADPLLMDLKELEAIGYQPAHYYIGMRNDTANIGAPVFVQRTPLYFKDNQNLSRGVYFANFFLWMGKIRESGTYPIMASMAEQLITGKWGLVTNSSFVQILGEATSGDIVEVHFWMSNVFGRDNSTFDLFYDWRKILADGSHERIALGEMRASWVKILDHGLVAPEPLPDYFNNFAQAMQAREEPRSFQPLPESLKHLSVGDYLYESPVGPKRGHLMFEEEQQPTLEDANLVGNVYFSNYARWQGVVRDKFFYNMASEYFRGIGEKGELITTFCEVEHLREAMPFDNIVISMYLVAVGETGVELRFEYFRKDADDSRVKLAAGKQTTVWAAKNEQGDLKALPWPEVFKNGLMRYVNGESPLAINDSLGADEASFTFVD